MIARDVTEQCNKLMEQRGIPQFIRPENGHEFVAKAEQKRIGERGFETLFIAPESPWQNVYSENFDEMSF